MNDVSADLPLDSPIESHNDFLLNGDANERVYNLFFDFEFTGIHQETTPISLGIVSDTGKEFYAEFTDYDRKQVDPWIQANVLNNTLYLGQNQDRLYESTKREEHYWEAVGPKEYVAFRLKEWLKENFQTHYYEDGELANRIEFIGDCCAYDWMLLTDLVGEYQEMERRDEAPYLMNRENIQVDVNALPGIPEGMTKEEFLKKWLTYTQNLTFIEPRLYKVGLPKYPEGVNYIPTDLCTIFKVRGIDPDINREEYAGGMLKYIDEKPSKHNALWDAKVIKLCYDKTVTDEVGVAMEVVAKMYGYTWNDFRKCFTDTEGNVLRLIFEEI